MSGIDLVAPSFMTTGKRADSPERRHLVRKSEQHKPLLNTRFRCTQRGAQEGGRMKKWTADLRPRRWTWPTTQLRGFAKSREKTLKPPIQWIKKPPRSTSSDKSFIALNNAINAKWLVKRKCSCLLGSALLYIAPIASCSSQLGASLKSSRTWETLRYRILCDP